MYGTDVAQELLPVIDAFEAAAGQVKAETECEQRIAGSYQVGPQREEPVGKAVLASQLLEGQLHWAGYLEKAAGLGAPCYCCLPQLQLHQSASLPSPLGARPAAWCMPSCPDVDR